MDLKFSSYFLAVSILLVAGPSSQQLCRTAFRQVLNASLCVRLNFTLALDDVKSDLECALRCNEIPDCPAFTVADGPCRLFVFDKCSKSVRDCSCSRRGRVFVKRQPGLEAGALCPSGYGDKLCGVKYRLINSTALWANQKLRCESDSSLAMLADVTDEGELSHVNALYSAHRPGIPVYLAGYRTFHGDAQTDGWFWFGCNTSMSGASVWAPNEPNMFDEKATALYPSVPSGLVDITDTGLYGALCECVSPFD